MMRGGKIFLLCVCGCISLSSISQTRIVNRSEQQWLQYYAQIKVAEKWTALADAGYRATDFLNDPLQYIVRGGVDYGINPNLHVAAGFAHLGFYSGGKENRIEFRPYQELLNKNKFNKVELTHRFRVEERIFHTVVNGAIQHPATFNFRFRYFFVASIPLFQLSKKNADKKVLLNVGDEIFINAGKEIVYNVFDQNRFLISPTLQVNPVFLISFTWNSQFGATSKQATYNYASVAWLQIRHKINFDPKKQRHSLLR